MAKRVLITGASGFTGRYLSQLLLGAGHSVVGVEIRRSEGSAGFASICCDLTDEKDTLQGAVDSFQPTHVVHLAAIANVTSSAPWEYYRTNVVGTENLLKSLNCGGKGIEKVVIASSANIYGNQRVSPIAETASPEPVSHYAASKLAMEHIARTFSDRLPIIIVRPFNYTGVGQSESYLVPKLVGHFVRGQSEIALGNIDIAREFSDVRHVATIYERLLDHGSPGMTVNICSGAATSVKDILGLLAEISGKSIRVSVDSRLVRAREIELLCGNNDLLTATIGELSPPSLRATLEWMYVHGKPN